MQQFLWCFHSSSFLQTITTKMLYNFFWSLGESCLQIVFELENLASGKDLTYTHLLVLLLSFHSCTFLIIESPTNMTLSFGELSWLVLLFAGIPFFFGFVFFLQWETDFQLLSWHEVVVLILHADVVIRFF